MATFNYDPKHFYTLNSGEIFDANQAYRMVMKRLCSRRWTYITLEDKRIAAKKVTSKEAHNNGCTISSLVKDAYNIALDLYLERKIDQEKK